MKNKLVFLAATVTLLVLSFALGGGTSLAQDQKIQSKVIAAPAQTTWLDNVSSNITGVSINQTVEIKNPTFKEVKEFILQDTANKHQFITNKYECRHFATDVNNNAEAAGIRCAFVLLCYKNGQHAVVGFETVDRGMIYIEPQTDAAIQPVAGGEYQGEEIIEILVGW
jgi:hypothetical protein